jgi:hypothetical protein
MRRGLDELRVRQKICKYCSFGGDPKLLYEYFRLEIMGAWFGCKVVD